MKFTLLATRGYTPDISFFNGQWIAVWQTDETLFVRGAFNKQFNLDAGALAFPRLDSSYLVYRKGANPIIGGNIILGNLSNDVFGIIGNGAGNDCCAIGSGFVWIEKIDRWVVRFAGNTGQTTPVRQLPGLTGISRGFPDGSFLSVDEDRNSPIGTRPCYASDIIVAEAPNGGVNITDGKVVMLLWSNEDTQTPRVAVSGNNIAVVTWGNEGIRLVELTRDEIVSDLPAPPIPIPQPPNNGGIMQPYPDENSWWNDFTSKVNALYSEANVPSDDGKFKWFARTAYDIAAGLTKEQSEAKHIKELRQELGLDPQ